MKITKVMSLFFILILILPSISSIVSSQEPEQEDSFIDKIIYRLLRRRFFIGFNDILGVIWSTHSAFLRVHASRLVHFLSLYLDSWVDFTSQSFAILTDIEKFGVFRKKRGIEFLSVLNRPGHWVYYSESCFTPRYALRYWPVYEYSRVHKNSGVPSAMISPPRSPPSGPRSIM